MSLTVQCVECGRLTSVDEANLRKFNPARCVCGGGLVAKNYEDTYLAAAQPPHTKTNLDNGEGQ